MTFPEPTFHGYRCTTWHAIPDPCESQGPTRAVYPGVEELEEGGSMRRLPPVELPPDVSIDRGLSPTG